MRSSHLVETDCVTDAHRGRIFLLDPDVLIPVAVSGAGFGAIGALASILAVDTGGSLAPRSVRPKVDATTACGSPTRSPARSAHRKRPSGVLTDATYLEGRESMSSLYDDLSEKLKKDPRLTKRGARDTTSASSCSTQETHCEAMGRG